MSIVCMWLIDITLSGLLQMEVYSFLLIGSFSPALHAMLIIAVMNPSRSKASSHTQIIAFAFLQFLLARYGGLAGSGENMICPGR